MFAHFALLCFIIPFCFGLEDGEAYTIFHIHRPHPFSVQHETETNQTKCHAPFFMNVFDIQTIAIKCKLMVCKNKALGSTYKIPLEHKTVGDLVFDFFLFYL